MKLAMTTALATVAALAATSASAQYTQGQAAPQQQPQAGQQAQGNAQAKGQIKLSRKASKAIVALQKAVQANDTANIPAALDAAKAVADTAEDRYAIGQLQLKAALGAKNNEAAVLAVDYIATANYLPKPTVAGLYNQLGVEFYNAKNVARATQLFQKALTVDPANSESQRLLAESQLSANPAQAAGAMKKAIMDAAATGQKLPEGTYKRALKAAYDSKSTDAVDIGRAWIAAYPTAESWYNGIAIYRNMQHPDVEGSLNLLRLLRAVNALNSSSDYVLYASAAADQGNFAEAQLVIDEGLKAGKVNSSGANARDVINGLKTKPKATAADLAVATRDAKSANAHIAIGNRYYGLGDYAKAVESYRKAMTMSGVDMNLANLHLGMALARSGDKAGATTALNAVTGEYAPIAKYWLIYAKA
ncbi:MAG TPA: tetratricopeptide repeat protein [Sphingomicrobium sp.]|nr:tetratricopeptide repeat protein [Sphingomicrobium sp.]